MGYYRGPGYPRADRDRDQQGDRTSYGRSDQSQFGYGGADYGRSDNARNDYARGDYGRNDRPDRNRYDPRGDHPRDNYARDDHDDRGFFDRAGDEVRSWFGDEEAERRRERDAWENRRYGDPRDQSSRIGFFDPTGSTGYVPFTNTERSGNAPELRQGSGWRENYTPDPDYHAWRSERINELDRDYDEYRSENRNRFNQEFNNWRTRRTSQRSSLDQAREHMTVVGSDGEHVGTVDKVAGDRIILTKNDADAGGKHHWIPSRWIDSIEGETVKLEKTADQAKEEWRNAERNGLFNENDANRANERGGNDRGDGDRGGAHYLNRSFSGTYR